MGPIERQVKNFVVENFLFGEGGDDLTTSQSFLASGIIDSTGVLELIAFIEETYHVEVADNELTPDNLDSIAGVTRFVMNKQKAA